MRVLVLSLLVLLSACGGGGNSDPQQVQVVAPVIAIDGDSLADQSTAKWPAQLAAQYPATYIDNALVGSESWRPLAFYPSVFHQQHANVYVLIVGTNDLHEGLAGIPETFASIRNTWKLARADGAKVIASTVANARAFQGQDDATAQAYREQLNALIRGASSEYDALIELDKLLPNQDDTAAYIDGVHFTDAGARVVTTAILAAITQ